MKLSATFIVGLIAASLLCMAIGSAMLDAGGSYGMQQYDDR